MFMWSTDFVDALGFNRYMVECEYLSDTMHIYPTSVLIDTWWNVNINFSGKMAQMSTF